MGNKASYKEKWHTLNNYMQSEVKETESSPGQKFQLPQNTRKKMCEENKMNSRWLSTVFLLLICSASTLGQTMISSLCFAEILPLCIINVSRNIKTTIQRRGGKGRYIQECILTKILSVFFKLSL